MKKGEAELLEKMGFPLRENSPGMPGEVVKETLRWTLIFKAPTPQIKTAEQLSYQLWNLRFLGKDIAG